MNITFSVLWFDDREDFFDSLDIDWLKNQIKDWGFSPVIIPVTTPEKFTRYAPYEKIDLIVVDRNLEEYGEGQTFIEDLRSHAVYTEVIFYSAGNASDLWDAIREKELEGVYVSNKGTILQKISKVGRQSIRKVLDLENMRGIVMAELGELDHLLNDILKLGLSGLPIDMQTPIYKKFQEQLSEQNKKTETRLSNFVANPDIEGFIDLSDDSYKRWTNFQRLSKTHQKIKSVGNVGDFATDILSPRNFLAHGKPETNEDGDYVFYHRGKEYIFNNDVSSDLRKTILRYKDLFLGIIEMLN